MRKGTKEYGKKKVGSKTDKKWKGKIRLGKGDFVRGVNNSWIFGNEVNIFGNEVNIFGVPKKEMLISLPIILFLPFVFLSNYAFFIHNVWFYYISQCQNLWYKSMFS